jgi:ABC-type branched-subunit amino acid transport system ATPase component
LAAQLSGGEQQMLGLSKALMLRPRLLLIDELSLGLAPIVVGQLLDMVRLINADGTAVVLVEQSVNIALNLVDHAYFMEKGEMRFDGRAQDLLGRDDLLRAVFLQGADAAS